MDATKWTRGQVLGRGSTATVSLATDLSSGESFAVKSSQLSRSDFLRHEQRVHSLIRSPFVISYLGFGVSDSCFNLFLEYAPGGSVHDEVKKRGPLPESAARPLVKDVISGLADLHSAGVAHCDIKPQNILIGRGGRAKVADLGCARFVGRGGGGAKGKFMGTPMFMAPEVARGEEQGTAADIWAVGCTVVEMATGRPPWPDATDAVALLHRVGLTGGSPETPAWLSEEGKDFLGRCLARDARDRWTADELLRHPFVSDCVPDSDPGCNNKWTSPKSTLDRSFWDSLPEEEEEEEEEDETNLTRGASNAINDLFGGGGGGGGGAPNWTWDEDWLTVRIEENDEVELITPAGSSGETTVAANSPVSTGIGGEEFVYSADHMITGELRRVSCDNCDVIFSDNCGNVTELWSSNCIFTVTCGCRFAFVLCSLVRAVSSALIVGLRLVNFLQVFNLECRPLRRIHWPVGIKSQGLRGSNHIFFGGAGWSFILKENMVGLKLS